MNDQKWVLFNLYLPPETKYMIEQKAFNMKLKQSELVRQSIDMFLAVHAETDGELAAADIASRQRKERLGLMKPKDSFRTEMIIAGAWHTIKKAKAEYEDMGILGAHHYDMWIRRCKDNIKSLDDDNPEREVMIISFTDLMERLGEERDERFPLAEISGKQAVK